MKLEVDDTVIKILIQEAKDRDTSVDELIHSILKFGNNEGRNITMVKSTM